MGFSTDLETVISASAGFVELSNQKFSECPAQAASLLSKTQKLEKKKKRKVDPYKGTF